MLPYGLLIEAICCVRGVGGITESVFVGNYDVVNGVLILRVYIQLCFKLILWTCYPWGISLCELLMLYSELQLCFRCKLRQKNGHDL